MKRLYNKLKSKLKRQFGDDKIVVKPQDVYLVSFPKSGNTWMRFLLINYLFNFKNEKLIYDDLEKFIPSVHKSSKKSINSRKGDRIIKSHFVEPFYPKIIYVIRDGRDALVSYYYYQKDLRGFEGSFEDFYDSDFSSDAGTWDEHLRAAIKYEEKNSNDIIFIKYEDLKSNPEEVFGKVITFLGKSIDKKQLKFAIENSSFNKLKQMQESDGVEIEERKINFFRKGTSNQWTNYFSEKMNSHFVEKSQDLLKRFNYTKN